MDQGLIVASETPISAEDISFLNLGLALLHERSSPALSARCPRLGLCYFAMVPSDPVDTDKFGAVSPSLAPVGLLAEIR